jgi:hypothetical protein
MDNSRGCTNEDVQFGNKLRKKHQCWVQTNIMSQHDYFIKGLYVLSPPFFFHMNEFWNNYF